MTTVKSAVQIGDMFNKKSNANLLIPEFDPD